MSSSLRLAYLPLDINRVLARSRQASVVRMELQLVNMVAVGELSPAQGFDLLLAALPLVKRIYPRFHLHLVGEERVLDFLLAQYLKAGLVEQVTFLGEVG